MAFSENRPCPRGSRNTNVIVSGIGESGPLSYPSRGMDFFSVPRIIFEFLLPCTLFFTYDTGLEGFFFALIDLIRVMSHRIEGLLQS